MARFVVFEDASGGSVAVNADHVVYAYTPPGRREVTVIVSGGHLSGVHHAVKGTLAEVVRRLQEGGAA